jgi:prepilin peptidase CpaA
MSTLDPISFLLATLFLGLLALAVLTDVEELKIPNRISLALVLLYPADVIATPQAEPWLEAIAVALAVFTVGFAGYAARLIGGGDVKLLTAVALWAGPDHVIPLLWITVLVGGALGLVMATRVRFLFLALCQASGASMLHHALLRQTVPYAIAIAAGAYATVGLTLLHVGP